MNIAIIGGAGVRTINFINGLILAQDSLQVDEIRLYDIDKVKLDIISQLAKYVVKRNRSQLRVVVADTTAVLLQGADVVVTTLRVGADHSRVLDERIALKYGLIGQETTGVGGFFMAARTIPVLLAYMSDIRKYAPNAIVFNFTNPSGLVTQAMSYAGFDQVFGICDAPSSVVTRMADALEVDESRIKTLFAGLNHLSWIQSVEIDGEECLDKLIGDDSFLSRVQEFAIFDKNTFRLSGYLPNEYLYYYYHREKALSSMQSAGLLRGEMIEEINMELFAELSKTDISADPENALQTFLFYIWKRELSYMTAETGSTAKLPERGKLEIPTGMGYAGVMLSFLKARASGSPADVVLNIPNCGAIDFLEDDDIIEVSCCIKGTEVYPYKPLLMNDHCKNLLLSIKAYERTAARAILEQSRPKAIEALTLHPLVMSYSLAESLIDELIRAYPNDIKLN